MKPTLTYQYMQQGKENPEGLLITVTWKSWWKRKYISLFVSKKELEEMQYEKK